MVCSAISDMSRMPMMNVLGLSGFPVLYAGQASWQRPHSVQVKPSRTSFQPRSWSVLSPNVAVSSSRSIFGSSPRGASLRNQTFTKLVYTWKCLFVGMNSRNAARTTTCAHQSATNSVSVTIGAEARERDREGVRHDRASDVAVRRRLEGQREELGRDDQGDHRQDQQPGPVERQPRSGAIDQPTPKK